MPTTAQLVRQLATARQKRTNEITIQSLIHHVLADPALGLGRITLEYPLPGGRRIDLYAGRLAVEVKRDLRPAGALGRAAEQVGGYLHALHTTTHRHHIGVVTDGVQWFAYQRDGSTLRLVGRHTVRHGLPEHEAQRLIEWLNHMHTTRPRATPVAKPKSTSSLSGDTWFVLLVFTILLLLARQLQLWLG
ncbi:hypothetical protein FFT09_22590 [Saccharomonospora piscinae]|uniref:hypothetical protein n=1 Tax=Saccharomonospora piscinae TaxID=687388 RepID=UPI00110685B0|nr:hypothetical protein [Saccharomonospora piscinae]TLW89222.1 hypothetical protein FFT09_22590 [Saccharomonospora piscinae]